MTATADVAAPVGNSLSLDMLLTQAALGVTPHALPIETTVHVARALAARPRRVIARGASVAGELGRIAVGRSDVAPSRRDRQGWALIYAIQ